MNHLTQEDLILIYYGEPEAAVHEAHLAQCAECQSELGRLAATLDTVTPYEVPDPGADYEARVWDRLRWRLRGEKRRARLTPAIVKWTAVAAVAGMGFCTGMVWRRTPQQEQQQVARVATPASSTTTSPTTTAPHATSQQNAPFATASNNPNRANDATGGGKERILLVVVGDHFDQSERVLVELTNLTPGEGTVDISNEREHAEALLASNRLYRRTATDRGEENVATLLGELEPVLLQIAHAPDDLSPNELRRIQKRVAAKGLVFKLRVVRAGVRTQERMPIQQPSV
ncbi:MAG: hypothetical protein JO197_00770 [Acidobacteria bacterium]|nr:hypothetical protein [Acidobacteriota bacterium]MBV9476353.1 hypothetical protein [Acidobacteriota bacterium]